MKTLDQTRLKIIYPARVGIKRLRRHKDIVLRTSEGVTPASGNVSEYNIRSWFEKIEIYLKEENYFYILNDPQRVFNADETGFQLCPKNKKVLVPKGAKMFMK